MNNGTTAVGNGAQAGSTAAGQGSATAVGDNALANALQATALGALSSASGANSVAVGTSATVSGISSVGVGFGANASGQNSVAIGNNSSATQANVVSFGFVGAERRLVNLAPGTVASGSTDGVNGGQLFTANQRVANAFGGGAGLDANGQLTAPSYTIQGTNFNNVGAAFTAVNNVITMQNATGPALATQIAMNTTNIANITNNGTMYYQSNSTGPGASATGANANAIGSSATASGTNALAFGTGSQATQSGSIAIGLNSASTGTNAIAIGTGAVATGSVAVGFNASAANGGAAYGDGAVATAPLSTAIGPNSSATAANSVAIGSGSTNTVANTVSVGSVGAERRITNVAAGINQTDAVNVGQLQSTAAGFQSQIGGLQNQINDNRYEARGGVALALASGGLRFDDRPGKLSVAGAYGNFKGVSGLAFGVGYAPTNRLRFNATISGSPDQGSIGGVVGGSITLN